MVFSIIIWSSVSVLGQTDTSVKAVGPTAHFKSTEIERTANSSINNPPYFSSRLAGTKQGENAENWIFNELTQLGYKPKFQPHEVPVWHSGKCNLEVVPYKSDNFVPFSAISLSGSCLKADSNTRIFDAGSGSDEELNLLPPEAKNGLFLMNAPIPQLEQLPYWNLDFICQRAMQHGARAIIFVSPFANEHIAANVATPGALLNIPVFSITAEKGEELRKWLQEAKLVAFYTCTNKYSIAITRNIIASHYASDSASVLITTKLDGRNNSPSALDNGLGVGTLLSIAKKLKTDTSKQLRSVKLAFLMGEYSNNSGTSVLLQDGVKQYKYVINLATPSKITAISTSGRLQSAKALLQVLPNNELSINSRFFISESVLPFVQKGIPSLIPQCNVGDTTRKYLCTNADNAKLFQKEVLDYNTDIIYKTIQYLTSVPELPDPVLKKRKLKKWLAANGIPTLKAK